MRPPLSLLRQRDDFACETTIAMQLLYMAGKLQPAQFNSFDRRIGRRRGKDDFERNGLRELLKAGFSVTIYSDCDRRKIISEAGLEYLQNHWREKGQDEQAVAHELPQAFSSILTRTRNLLEIMRSHRGQVTPVPRLIELDEFVESLERGGQAVCDYVIAGGLAHTVLVTGMRQGRCIVYDPLEGVRRVCLKKFFRKIDPSPECFYPPV